MWSLEPEDLKDKDEVSLLSSVSGLFLEPDRTIARVKELYQHPDEESKDRLELKDGRVFERSSLPEVSGNEIIGRVWSYHDITDLMKAGSSLKKSEQKFRDIFDMAADALMIQDKEGRFLEVNEVARKRYGYSREEFLGLDPRKRERTRSLRDHQGAVQDGDTERERIVRVGPKDQGRGIGPDRGQHPPYLL